MKKIICLFLVFVMVLSFSGTIFAAGIDLDSMSIEELVELRDNVINKLNELLNPVNDVIGVGTYLVGRDIKEGVFAITVREDESGSYKIFETPEKHEAGEYFAWENVWGNDVVTVNLKEGMVFCILGWSGSIVEEVKPSWAP